ncbi:EF-hand domain-containing protein D2 homolog [Drosophila takahashii]|uniref:EF-hand domain-containing protein D2 homolog n=1 Tax=Drosophila takahashii TaxID=29030 RepID=UPI001CF8C772|nr:EF-hand domain-containing protein D2 homolog [Drosophila takahashii]
MSEAVGVRGQFETPAARSNESQASLLRDDRKIVLEKRVEVEVCEEIISSLNIPEDTEDNFEAAEAADKVSELPEESKEESNEFAFKDICLIEKEEEDELSSGSSFTSCCSFKYIRKSILSREIRNASTLSLDSGVDIDSLTDPSQNRHIDQEQGIGDNNSSVSVVMEKRLLSLTPEGSDCDCELSLDEVYQRFSAWFNRTEVDSSFSCFMQVDEDLDGYICLGELKRFLEKLDMPQTHLAVKKVMTHVVGNHEGQLNFCQALLIQGTLMKRLELRKWCLQDREKQRLARSEAVDVSQVGVSGARRFFEAKIALQTEPLALNSDQPVTKTALNNSPISQKAASKREQFKSAAAVFKKLESDQ